MVIFDANFLLLLLDPDVDIPMDPVSGRPLTRAKDRVEHLISILSQQRETIGIPTPVIAEVLVHAGAAGQDYLAVIGNSSKFRILPFDLRAAVEVAAMSAAAIATGDKKSGISSPWQKVKIDRQITAIGVMERATTIFADDMDVARLAKAAGIEVINSWSLPLPPEDLQGRLDV